MKYPMREFRSCLGMLSVMTLALVMAGCSHQASAPMLSSSVVAVFPPEVVNVTWQWVSFTSPGEQIDATDPDHYTLRFQRDGKVAAQVGCNRGVGTYALGKDRKISFAPMAVTRMMCLADTQSDRYLAALGRVDSYFLRDGALYLQLPSGSGTLRFRRQN